MDYLIVVVTLPSANQVTLNKIKVKCGRKSANNIGLYNYKSRENLMKQWFKYHCFSNTENADQ